MRLRDWQRACLRQAEAQYRQGHRHFLCLATPGAGKTHLAATLAATLLEADLVDLVIGFAPSVIVAEDIQAALAAQTGARFDGRLGARGLTLTYQSMLTQPEAFWSLFQTQRVFAIFDEIHHCAGQELADANAWGALLIANLQEQAAYTLALTGTPWRSDQRPIALARYGTDSVTCDYRYGLDRAIVDGVCRVPQLTLIDNDTIRVQRDGHTEHFNGLKALVDSDACRYEDILRSEALITYSLRQATRKLDNLRRHDPRAGGLVVASSVDHAQQIAGILLREFGVQAAVATYQERDPLTTIRQFKDSETPWIVSVGMISEGTNVPRLRVCCHLTRVKTELYFRQVLGRILRANGTRREKAYFYMPAEPTLVEYAERLIEDIPGNPPVIRDRLPGQVTVRSRDTTVSSPPDDGADLPEVTVDLDASGYESRTSAPSNLSVAYDTCVHWSTRFHSQILAIHGLSHS
jgi:superfamily II DNA or RNA helicase